MDVDGLTNVAEEDLDLVTGDDTVKLQPAAHSGMSAFAGQPAAYSQHSATTRQPSREQPSRGGETLALDLFRLLIY